MPTPIQSFTAEYSSPGPDDAHTEGPHEYQNTGIHSSFSTKNAPTLITEEVFRHQLDERCENEKSGGNGIHDTDNKQTDLRIGAVKRMCCEANCLPDWSPGILLELLKSGLGIRLNIRAAIGK